MGHQHQHTTDPREGTEHGARDPHSAAPKLAVFLTPLICLLGLLIGWGAEYLGSGTEASSASIYTWIAWLFYAVAYLAGGLPILSLSWQAARQGSISIDFLMLVAAAGSALIGEYVEGAVLLFLFSLSHSLESYILGRTRNAIRLLMDLSPEQANVIRNEVEVQLPIDQVVVGDLIVIRPSDRVPLDGVVISGRSNIDESMMTGESIPVEKRETDTILSGTLNLDGLLTVRVLRVAQESTLARMVNLVETAQSEQASTQHFTEWFDNRYPWIVIGATAGAFCVYWAINGDAAKAFLNAMTILVVASPCAVVISIPAAILTAIASGARRGILFKGGLYLERLAWVGAIALDKTGTLTMGRPQVVETIAGPGVNESELISLGAALEQDSEHPLAKAIRQVALSSSAPTLQVTNLQVVIGNGICGTLGEHSLKAGKINWLNAEVGQPPAELQAAIESHRHQGHSIVGVTRNATWLGVFCIADVVRPTSLATLDEIRQLGVKRLIMLTGDQKDVAASIAEPLQLEFLAELLPQQKLDYLEQLRREGYITAMVGDGMNDAPALAVADVGISLGGAGTDVALETADVVVMADDLRRLPLAIRLARQTQVIMTQNLTLAFGVMALLLISTLVSPLPLSIAVLGHEGSTVLVILNGLRLLWFK